MHFEFGQPMRESDLLLELDVAAAVRQHRAARVKYIEKRKALETVENWKNSTEMAGARRSLTRARRAIEDQERRLKRTRFLLEQGLIAQSEHEDVERQYQDQLPDFEATREDFDAVLAGGGEEALDKASLEFRTAEERMLELEADLDKGSIRAPLSGVVAGIAIGTGAAYGFCRFFEWEFLASPTAVAAGLGVSSAMGLFFGFQPAYQASRLDLIAALVGE